MYGIDLIAGHNDCYWNFEGRCTFDKYKKHRRAGQRDHDSKENCTLTQVGVQLCSWYEKEPL